MYPNKLGRGPQWGHRLSGPKAFSRIPRGCLMVDDVYTFPEGASRPYPGSTAATAQGLARRAQESFHTKNGEGKTSSDVCIHSSVKTLRVCFYPDRSGTRNASRGVGRRDLVSILNSIYPQNFQ